MSINITERQTQALLAPYMAFFQTDYISYSRLTDDNHHSAFSSNHDFASFCMNNQRYPTPSYLCNGFILWDSINSEENMKLIDEKFNLAYGVSFIVEREGYIETINFGFSRDNYHALQALLNRIKAVKHFANWLNLHFEEFRPLLLVNQFNHVAENKQSTSTVSQSMQELLTAKPPAELLYTLKGTKGTVSLTASEYDVFSRLLKLHSYKEIARDKNVSVATIDFHLKNIKKKLGISKRSDLYRLAEENMISIM